MSGASFDENNIESWYFGVLSFEESQRLLARESTGIFFVRDSSRTPGEYVLCLKEKNEVKQFPIHWKVVETENQYYLRDDLTFPDIPSMLSFYKRNIFETTSLIRPIEKKVPLRLNNPDKLRPTSYPTDTNMGRSRPQTAPPGFGLRPDEFEEKVYVRVSKNRSPSAYDNISLRLSVGDLIEVTEKRDTGHWVGILNGKKGVFPFSHVDIISEAEYLSGISSQ
ncbi:unnamed protein product [Allacma fusca]|uniref:Adapter molecule Crk n=1 Tax=Allacma fusca TaxID=39272 RepID=A0A8J2KRQ0_9HEXA|nr:unnamed protein product [Allacma fusca]